MKGLWPQMNKGTYKSFPTYSMPSFLLDALVKKRKPSIKICIWIIKQIHPVFFFREKRFQNNHPSKNTQRLYPVTLWHLLLLLPFHSCRSVCLYTECQIWFNRCPCENGGDAGLSRVVCTKTPRRALVYKAGAKWTSPAGQRTSACLVPPRSWEC